MRLHVIMACHNRVEKTTRCVDSLIQAAAVAGCEIDFTIFDDGSTDGTSAALRAMSPTLTLLRGSGFAYWARGMAAAERFVLETCTDKHDLLLWANDDVVFDGTCLTATTQFVQEHPRSVVAGATRTTDGQDVSYTGYRITSWNRLNISPVTPSDRATFERIDTFNGNFILLTLQTAELVGGIEPGFGHAFADIEYGHRCGYIGVQTYLAPATVGQCDRDSMEPANVGLARQWRTFISRRGRGHPPSVWLALRKSRTPLWPAVFVYVYIAWWKRAAFRSLHSRVSRTRRLSATSRLSL